MKGTLSGSVEVVTSFFLGGSRVVEQLAAGCWAVIGVVIHIARAYLSQQMESRGLEAQWHKKVYQHMHTVRSSMGAVTAFHARNNV